MQTLSWYPCFDINPAVEAMWDVLLAVSDADSGDGVLCFDTDPAVCGAYQQLCRLHVFMAGHHANAG